MKQPYNTALYMRLSRDDENFGDSVSIETQRTILRQFAKENNLRVYDEYIDDGWSGTNFDRPNFRRMMADVEAGKVNCIASKDLSRFGREHIMMDYYLEFVFPEKGIRIHAGNKPEDTQGCILVGENRVKGMVVNSRIWLHRLMNRIQAAENQGEGIWITII